MPTPFMHLDYAEQIRTHPVLRAEVRAHLEADWAAFCLGSIAADYQAISDIPRAETHFYPVPMPPDLEPVGHRLMWQEHPQMAQAAGVSAENAAFNAGYSVHLLADVIWNRQILLPFFIYRDAFEGEGRRERFTALNTLLTFLDRESLQNLSLWTTKHAEDPLPASLARANPQDYAPFIRGVDLARWQTMIVEQLEPGFPIRTVEIYAERLGLSAETFTENLDSAAWMQENIFNRAPRDEVTAILTSAVDQSVDLLNAYW